VLSNTNE